jgi:hypothetical protein
MVIPLRSLLPTADDVLNAELETLGGLLLRHLKSCERVSPVFQHGGLNRDYFLAIMERRNIGLGPLPSNEPEYGAKQSAVSRAFVEAWDWLVREGLLIRNHQQPAELYLISRKGEKLLQNENRQDRGEAKVKNGNATTAPAQDREKWDVFISHASEDKPYVKPLAEALRVAGISVWYDNMVMNWGDDLRPMIDKGLTSCRFGIVVLSKAFLAKKKWTEHELNSLFAREQFGQKLVLPIWHGIQRDDLLAYSPALADRLAKISETDTKDNIVGSLLDLLGRSILDEPLSKGGVTSAAGFPQRGRPSSRITRGASDEPDHLGPREMELLWNAAKDPNGEILHSRTLSGDGMRSNGRQFLEDADARTGAEWLGAVRRLETRGFIEPLSGDRDFFRVTSEGYEAADRLEGFARWDTQSIVLRARYFNATTEEHTIRCKGIIAVPPSYFPDQIAADGTVAQSVRERRSLLIDGIDRRPPDGWKPTEVEFNDTIGGQVQVFLVEGVTVVPPARLRIPLLD